MDTGTEHNIPKTWELGPILELVPILELEPPSNLEKKN